MLCNKIFFEWLGHILPVACDITVKVRKEISVFKFYIVQEKLGILLSSNTALACALNWLLYNFNRRHL